MESVGHWRQEFAYHRPRPESLVKEEEMGEDKTLKTELLSAQGLNWAAKYRSIQFWHPWDEREQSDLFLSFKGLASGRHGLGLQISS